MELDFACLGMLATRASYCWIWRIIGCIQKGISYVAKSWGHFSQADCVHIFPTLLIGPWSLWSYGNRFSSEHCADTQEWTARCQDGGCGESAETTSRGNGKRYWSQLRGGSLRLLRYVQAFLEVGISVPKFQAFLMQSPRIATFL